MAEQVEGDWKQFTFKMAKPEDYPKILAHLRKVFYREATFAKLLQYSDEDFEQIDHLVLHYLNQNDELSFYVEEKKSGKVAGVRLTYKQVCTPGPTSRPMPAPTEKIRNVSGFLEQIWKKSRIEERYGLDYYAALFMTSVDPEFRRQGLVTEIYRRTINLLRAKGYPACESVFTSPYARRAVEKLGFEELARLYFLDYKNEKGEVVLPNAEPDMFGASMALKL